MITTVLNKKIDEVGYKITYISGLVTAIVFNIWLGEVDSKIPDVSGLVKKTDYNAKISDIEAKYITTSDYNTFTVEIYDAKLKQAN